MLETGVAVISDPMTMGEGAENGEVWRWWLAAAATDDGIAVWGTNIPPAIFKGDIKNPVEPKDELRRVVPVGHIPVHIPLNKQAVGFYPSGERADWEDLMKQTLSAVGAGNARLQRAIECAKEAQAAKSGGG